jgi:excisionase family DNA binding protein
MMSAMAQSVSEPQFLTVAEVAALLRVTRRTIYEWTAQRKIPYRKAGRYTIFDRDEIVAWTKGQPGNTVTAGTFPR